MRKCQIQKKIEGGRGHSNSQQKTSRKLVSPLLQVANPSNPSMSVQLIESLKGLEASELVKVMEACVAETKRALKGTKPVAAKKEGSAPKGVVPPQLRTNLAWVAFVKERVQRDGWEAFEITESRKDKMTGQTSEVTTQMAASVEENGKHVFADSKKELTHKHAMTLSAQYWRPATKKTEASGSNEALYQEFLAQLDLDAIVAAPKAAKVEPTAEEVAAKKAAALEKRRATIAAKKEAAGEPATPAKKVAVKKATPTAPVKAAAPAAAATPVVPKKTKKFVDTFKAPDQNGGCGFWDWNGGKYLRNCHNHVWTRTDGGDYDAWCGQYDPETNQIDNSIDEPEF